jgi:hypothetical protein
MLVTAGLYPNEVSGIEDGILQKISQGINIFNLALRTKESPNNRRPSYPNEVSGIERSQSKRISMFEALSTSPYLRFNNLINHWRSGLVYSNNSQNGSKPIPILR